MRAFSGRLVLPGEAKAFGPISHKRLLLACAAGFLWFPVRSSLLPELGLGGLPFDPILPLVAAFALGGRLLESAILACVLGYLADLSTGVASGRTVLQYVVVALLAMPLHGRVVLRDRLLPVLGVTVLALVSSGVVLLALGGLGALVPGEASNIPTEVTAAALGTFVFWPVLRRTAGWESERTVGLGSDA